MSERWYPTKVDWWLAVILAAVPVMCVGFLLVSPIAARPILVGATGLVAAMYLGLVLPMRYAITDEHVVVRHGLVTQRIALRDITLVEPTRSPLSSPALSLDRLRITFGEGFFRSAMISPAAKAEFLAELAAKAKLERDGDRLVRR
jgi:hypothetical protein